jgi:purine-nucleoside phosphorylase
MSSEGAAYAQAEAAARYVLKKCKLRPKIALALGSGLGAFADEIAGVTRIPYGKIPNFPRSTAIGHAGQLIIGTVEGVEVACMQGRVHLYEGYSAQDVAFPVRVFARMGVQAAILTNAAGGVKKEFTQGRLVVISDHINLQGANPLTGANQEQFGTRFPDMTAAYDKTFRELTLAEGRRLGIRLGEGVYAAVAGPNYETPAEIRYLRTIGADLVGMSTVPEVIAARHAGIRVLGISCVTNAAAGILDKPLEH